MKSKYNRLIICPPLCAIAFTIGLASAGTTETTAMSPVAPAQEDVVSGVLKFDLNTHFISYGNDTWSDGNPQLGELDFNPFLELSFALPANFKATLGTWWDVTDKLPSTSIGGDLREVDVWGGLAYTYDKFTLGLVYQAWMYGDSTEDILDVNFSYDCFLLPTLIVHNRLSPGASGGDDGTVIVAGISYGFEAGPVTVSFPVNVAYFATADYHGPSADTGFGYASIGVTAALPLNRVMGSAFGDWTLNGGLIYYFTDTDITVNNEQSDFLTASLGVSVAF